MSDADALQNARRQDPESPNNATQPSIQSCPKNTEKEATKNTSSSNIDQEGEKEKMEDPSTTNAPPLPNSEPASLQEAHQDDQPSSFSTAVDPPPQPPRVLHEATQYTPEINLTVNTLQIAPHTINLLNSLYPPPLPPPTAPAATRAYIIPQRRPEKQTPHIVENPDTATEFPRPAEREYLLRSISEWDTEDALFFQKQMRMQEDLAKIARDNLEGWFLGLRGEFEEKTGRVLGRCSVGEEEGNEDLGTWNLWEDEDEDSNVDEVGDEDEGENQE
ncbi:unnamed protein product [Periconia digitata]|uniref:Uncharacterized protein n=1 Tax=Periconia digitata TaxID=1303443 RepID=A0A9W4UGF6_9PLEO|nr:unnamed protein product [Periconia digitata]